jgi:GDP-L-fucose synthase
LIRKCIEAKIAGAKSIEVWGTGTPTREFLYVDDAARGITLATEQYQKPDPVNLGSSAEISIRDLVALIAELTGFDGEIVYDASKPDGQPRRKLNVDRAKREFGFTAETPFRVGLQRTIDWFKAKSAPSSVA